MRNSYIPKASIDDFCEGLHLCSVRKKNDGTVHVGVKDLQGNIHEEPLETIINADTYNGKKIIRTYSSGHVFLNENATQVFLITTEKEGKTQHQFTGGSPLEEENKEVIVQKNGVYKFDITKVKNNATIRTKNRTGVTVTKTHNQRPLVDWALMEREENGSIYYRLVCLMHFVVQTYEGDLGCTGHEDTLEGNRYNIETLPTTKNVAPNAYIVSKKAQELIQR